MLKLFPISVCAWILAYVSHCMSKYDKLRQVYLKKERIVWFCMVAMLAIFVGLRVHYNDTGAYTHAYDILSSSKGSLLQGMDWSIGSNPGFFLTNRILSRLGLSTQSFLMFYAVVTVGIYLWFIRKYTNNLWISLFLFITAGCYTFSMAAIKQTVAVAFCLLAVDKAIQKKYVWFIFWILIAITFHPYAIMYAIVPFMMFTPWTKRTWKMLLIFGVAGILFQFLLGAVIGVTSLMGEEYTAQEFTGDGVNPFRLAVAAVPAVLSFIIRKEIEADNNPIMDLVVNLSMLNAEIMFVGLFGTANYLARLANYFLIFQTLSLPLLINHFRREQRTILMVGMVIGYLLYFTYENVFAVNFDSDFNSISLLEYLRSLF